MFSFITLSRTNFDILSSTTQVMNRFEDFPSPNRRQMQPKIDAPPQNTSTFSHWDTCHYWVPHFTLCWICFMETTQKHYHLYESFQSRFRSLHSTETHLLKVTNDLLLLWPQSAFDTDISAFTYNVGVFELVVMESRDEVCSHFAVFDSTSGLFRLPSRNLPIVFLWGNEQDTEWLPVNLSYFH